LQASFACDRESPAQAGLFCFVFASPGRQGVMGGTHKKSPAPARMPGDARHGGSMSQIHATGACMPCFFACTYDETCFACANVTTGENRRAASS